jgi:hypothetical protein
MIDMAKAEVVKAWIKDFTTEGERLRAGWVVEADDAAAEFSISFHEHNRLKLRFRTTSREEAESRVREGSGGLVRRGGRL